MPDKQQQAHSSQKAGWIGFVPFVLLAVMLLAVAAWLVYQQQAVKTANLQERKLNEKLGLPEGYPNRIIPVYSGATIVESKHEGVSSEDGKPMDKWYIGATSGDTKEQVHDFYTGLAEKLDMSQTMAIQIPTGYGFNYANEKLAVEFTAEEKPEDELTHLEITLYMLK